jgi:D-3-phosphoglycerate dehydrogenase
MRWNILVAEANGFSQAAAATLAGCGDVSLSDLDRKGLLATVGDAHVVWIRLRNRVDSEVLEAASRLRVIASPTTGLNHIDLKEAERREIKVVSLRGEYEFLEQIYATAEHTVALLLAGMRNLAAAAEHVRQGDWNRDLFQGHELHGKTAGIVGCGRLGRMVARYLTAFGMKVVVTDPNVALESVPPGVTLVSLGELLRRSDIVSLHVDLNKQTEGFFGYIEFAQMKPGAYFVNTARGELVVEEALVDALSSGQLAGAAVDVICDEQAGTLENPLVTYAKDHRNLIVTPHIAGCTAESMEKTEIFIASRVAVCLGSMPENRRNGEASAVQSIALGQAVAK